MVIKAVLFLLSLLYVAHSQIHDAVKQNEELPLLQKRYVNDIMSMDQNAPWTIVPLFIFSGPLNFAPTEYTIYLINEIKTNTLVFFDGRNRPNHSTANNWAVIFADNLEYNPFSVSIYADPKSNCTVIFNAPSVGVGLPSIQEFELSNTASNFGLIKGIYSVQTFGVDNLQISSLTPVNITVTGSPGNSHLVMNSVLGSTVRILFLDTNALISTFSHVIIEKGVISRRCAIAIGHAENITLDVYNTTFYADYNSGCFFLPEIAHPLPSEWLKENFKIYLNSTPQNKCGVYMENSKYLHVKVVGLNVTNLDKFYLLGVELIQGRRLVLLDGGVWRSAFIHSTYLVTDKGHVVGISDSSNGTVIIPSSVLDATTNVSIISDNGNDGSVYWGFYGQDSDIYSVDFAVGNSEGHIYTATKPHFHFSGPNSAHLNIDSRSIDGLNEFNAVLYATNATISNDEQKIFSFSYTKGFDLKFSVETFTSPNTFTVYPDGPLPFIISHNQSTNLTIFNSDFSILIYGDKFTSNLNTETFETIDSYLNVSNCIDPLVHGRSSFWSIREWEQGSDCDNQNPGSTCSPRLVELISQVTRVKYYPNLQASGFTQNFTGTGVTSVPVVLIEVNPFPVDTVTHNYHWLSRILIPFFLFIAWAIVSLVWTFGPMHRSLTFLYTNFHFHGLAVQDYSITLFYIVALLLSPAQSNDTYFTSLGIHRYLLMFTPVCTVVQGLLFMTINIFFLTFIIFGTILYYFFIWKSESIKNPTISIVILYIIRFLNVIGLFLLSPVNFWLYPGEAIIAVSCVFFVLYSLSFFWSDYISLKHYRNDPRNEEKIPKYYLWSIFSLFKIMFVCFFLRYPDGIANIVIAIVLLILTILVSMKWLKNPLKDRNKTFVNIATIILLVLYTIFAGGVIITLSIPNVSYFGFVIIFSFNHLIAFFLFIVPIIAHFYVAPDYDPGEDSDSQDKLKFTKLEEDDEVEMKEYADIVALDEYITDNPSRRSQRESHRDSLFVNLDSLSKSTNYNDSPRSSRVISMDSPPKSPRGFRPPPIEISSASTNPNLTTQQEQQPSVNKTHSTRYHSPMRSTSTSALRNSAPNLETNNNNNNNNNPPTSTTNSGTNRPKPQRKTSTPNLSKLSQHLATQQANANSSPNAQGGSNGSPVPRVGLHLTTRPDSQKSDEGQTSPRGESDQLSPRGTSQTSPRGSVRLVTNLRANSTSTRNYSPTRNNRDDPPTTSPNNRMSLSSKLSQLIPNLDLDDDMKSPKKEEKKDDKIIPLDEDKPIDLDDLLLEVTEGKNKEPSTSEKKIDELLDAKSKEDIDRLFDSLISDDL